MSTPLPARTRVYSSYIFESRNWDRYRPRPGDIVVSTSYKSGTTWMQNILRRLLFPSEPRPAVSAVSPWLDRRNAGLDAMIAALEAQQHRRFIKSHMPLDALPYFPEVRYIVVVRDPRDVFMSFWNHYSEFTDAYHAEPLPPGIAPMPRCPADIHALWPLWMSRGRFPWESEGWPHSGNLYHTASWWRFRHLDNVLFIHFADLLADPTREITEVSRFIGIDATPARVDEIARAVTFDALRREAADAAPLPPERAAAIWRHGLDTFFFKGTNGRWRDVLSPDELVLYEAAKARCLAPDCAAYLETGRVGLTPRAMSRTVASRDAVPLACHGRVGGPPRALPQHLPAATLAGAPEDSPMPEPSPAPAAEALASAARAARRKGPPPVHLWDPPFCGDLDMRIARDGTWFYLGTPIGRAPLVRLFSSILKREGDRYFLVTPVEKVGITVDDAPFVAVDFAAEGESRAQTLTFTTHVGDTVTAGPEHPIRVERDPVTAEPAPYVMVRRGLDALIDRKSFYRLAELGCEEKVDGTLQFGVWSAGKFFPLIPASELAAG